MFSDLTTRSTEQPLTASTTSSSWLSNLEKCHGYCGRPTLNSSCTACPRGTRVLASSLADSCQPCLGPPSIYDWLYLGFMAGLPLIFSVFVINRLSLDKQLYSRRTWFLYPFTFTLHLFCACFVLLLHSPVGSLNIYQCPVLRLADFYTPLLDPRPDLVHKLNCASEAVYPLVSLVLAYDAACVVVSSLTYPVLTRYLLHNTRWMRALYYMLYCYPLLALIHALGSGLVYYSFAALTLAISLVHSAYLFTRTFDLGGGRTGTGPVSTTGSILLSTLIRPQRLLPVGCTWLFHFYGVVSLTRMVDPLFYGPMMIIIPLPYIFFALSVKFSDPAKLMPVP